MQTLQLKTFLAHDNPPLNRVEPITNADNEDPVQIVHEKDRLIMEQESDPELVRLTMEAMTEEKMKSQRVF